ncbi:MAG TPA: helix-turn-helix domain-containing protein, partial [Pirellulales bacterium]
FRGDLYYRLNVFTIRLPPLRDRGGDVDALIDHYVRRYSKEFHKENVEVPAEVRELLRQYPWPGNIRELQGVVKQALLRSTGSVVVKEALPRSVLNGAARPALDGESSGLNLLGATNGHGAPPIAAPRAEAAPARDDWEELVDKRIAEGSENLYDEWLRHVERRFLVQVLRKTEGNQLRAAKVLGITRTTLRNKLRQLGISIDREIDATP